MSDEMSSFYKRELFFCYLELVFNTKFSPTQIASSQTQRKLLGPAGLLDLFEVSHCLAHQVPLKQQYP